LRNVVSLYFGSKVTVKLLDWVVRVVSAHEEPHPVGVPHNLAPNKLAIVTAESHRSVDPLWHVNIVLPLGEEVLVQLKTCKTRLEQSEAKYNTTEIDINY
jgi:hypothetical protein